MPMIKKLIPFFVLLFTSFHISGVAMEADGVAIPDVFSQSRTQMSQALGDWFVEKYSSNYNGHFRGTYYRVESCYCTSCGISNYSSDRSLYVKGLREGDPDADIIHDDKPSRLVEQTGSKYIRFVYGKEWQYLKEDIISVCLDPTVENMLKFKGMAFINLVAMEEVNNAEDALQTVLKGCTYNKIKPLPDDWELSFSEPLVENKDTTFKLFNLLNQLKELTGSGSCDWKFMSSALVELRQLGETIDAPTDITSAHQEFFGHLVEFYVGNRGDSVETRQWKTDLIIKACGLYKGIMSRDPVRALTYRTRINQTEIKPLFSRITIERQWQDIILSSSFINHQIDMAEMNLSLFSGDEGKTHMMDEVNRFKDSFVMDLQEKYALAQTIKQALLD